MIIAIIKISPVLHNRGAVIEILVSVKTMTLLKPGCVSCNIYEEYDGSQGIVYIEKWQSKEALHKHIRSDLYFRVLNAIELSNEAPEICFHEGSETSGVELIKAIRLKNKKGDR